MGLCFKKRPKTVSRNSKTAHVWLGLKQKLNRRLKGHSFFFDKFTCVSGIADRWSKSFGAELVMSSLVMTFQTPVQFCFNRSAPSCCNLCTVSRFITCSWCKADLCFSHFFIQYHICNKYIEQLTLKCILNLIKWQQRRKFWYLYHFKPCLA